MHQCYIVGTVVDFPQMRHGDNNKMVTEFIIASGEGDSEFKTTCIAYGKSAETASNLSPGGEVVVHGELEPRIVETESGKKNTFPHINVQKISRCGGTTKTPQATKTPQTTQARTRANTAPVGQPKSTPRSVPDYIDDIPF